MSLVSWTEKFNLLSDDIQTKLYVLAHNNIKKVEELTKKLFNIMETNPILKNQDEDFKQKFAYATLYKQIVVPIQDDSIDDVYKDDQPFTNTQMEYQLREPKLLLNIIEEAHKDGIIGNEHLIIAITIINALNKVKNSNPTSSNILISAPTGTGKDKVIKITLNIIAIRNLTYFHRTGLSDKVFRYWTQPSPDINSWNDVTMYIEDPEEDLLKGQTFRTVASGETETSVVKDQEIFHITMNGKPAFIVSSMNVTIDAEGARRWSGIPTDSNKTLNVNVQKNKIEKHLISLVERNEILRHALQNKLQEYDVYIPDLNDIEGYLEPTTINNTYIDSLIDYIKGSAIIHQYQREVNKQGQLMATWDDILNGLFTFFMVHEYSGSSHIENCILSVLLSTKGSMTISETLTYYNNLFTPGITRYKLTKELDNLMGKGTINVIPKFDETANRPVDSFYVKNRDVVIKNKKADFGNLNTKNKEGHQNDEKNLITTYKEGHQGKSRKLNICLSPFIRIMQNRVQQALPIDIYLTWLFCLNTKVPSLKEVIKRVKNEILGLNTKNEDLKKTIAPNDNKGGIQAPVKEPDILDITASDEEI